MNKSLWRCHVCNDIHLGLKGPDVCPSCGARDAFARSDHSESMKVIGESDDMVSKEEIVDAWTRFTEGKEFQLNPDVGVVSTLAHGVLENMRNHGMRYCPCRMTTGDFERDLRLICPCNFPSQERWKEDGECWCSLFVRRR